MKIPSKIYENCNNSTYLVILFFSEKSFARCTTLLLYVCINVLSCTAIRIASFIHLTSSTGVRIPYSANSISLSSCQVISLLGANISLGPLLQSVLITGIPQDIASIITVGKPSKFELKIKHDDCLMYL